MRSSRGRPDAWYFLAIETTRRRLDWTKSRSAWSPRCAARLRACLRLGVSLIFLSFSAASSSALASRPSSIVWARRTSSSLVSRVYWPMSDRYRRTRSSSSRSMRSFAMCSPLMARSVSESPLLLVIRRYATYRDKSRNSRRIPALSRALGRAPRAAPASVGPRSRRRRGPRPRRRASRDTSVSRGSVEHLARPASSRSTFSWRRAARPSTRGADHHGDAVEHHALPTGRSPRASTQHVRSRSDRRSIATSPRYSRNASATSPMARPVS